MNYLRALWNAAKDSQRDLIPADRVVRVFKETQDMIGLRDHDRCVWYSPHPQGTVEAVVAIAREHSASQPREDFFPPLSGGGEMQSLTRPGPRLVSRIFDISVIGGITVTELYADPEKPGQFYEREMPFSLAPLPVASAPCARQPLGAPSQR